MLSRISWILSRSYRLSLNGAFSVPFFFMACVYECISIVMGILSVVDERVGCDGMKRESVLVDAVVGAECCEEGWGGVVKFW